MFRRKKPTESDAPVMGDDVVVVVDQSVNPYLVLFHEPAGFRAEQVRGLRNRLVAMNPDGEPKTLTALQWAPVPPFLHCGRPWSA